MRVTIALICVCIGLAASAYVKVEEVKEKEYVVEEAVGEAVEDRSEKALGMDISKRYTGTVREDFTCYFANGTSTLRTVKQTSKLAHNRLRRKHSVPDLRWSNTLEASAKAHSQWMADNLNMSHSVADTYGENIGFISISENPGVFGPSCIIRNWYNEIMTWNFDTSSGTNVTGHFTQLVWKDTLRVGCGMSTVVDDRGWMRTYLACQYKPKGNIGGQYQANVLRPSEIRKHTQGDLDETGNCNFLQNCPSSYCPMLITTCCNTCAA